jgi:hypothetical protein
MRLAILLCLATRIAAADPTHDLDAHALATLTGCWQMSGERWTFRKTGEHGLQVIREITDSTYAERARIPRDVMFDATTNNFGFPAAGRIHAALFIFKIGKTELQAWNYWKPDESKSYIWSGNTFALAPCTR